jgi:aquaporin Z
MGGHVSGGHFNPAVSLAVLLRGKMASIGEFVGYVVSQCAGAIVAGLAVYAILGRTFAPAPAPTASVMGAFLVELLYTFALALVVLNAAASAKTHGNSFYGIAIGFTVVVAAFAGGPISGGAFNPAVGLGPILVDTMLGEGTLANLWLYLVAPLAGGGLAALVFGLQEREPVQLHAEPSRTPESRPA